MFRQLTVHHLGAHRALRTVVALAGFALAAACASKTATPAPTPAPAAPAPTVSQTCPDASDGPSIVAQAVEDAHRAMQANPTGPVPPVCLVSAFARITVVVPDSLDQHAIAIAGELDRRGADRRELLAAEIALLSRAHRYQEVSRAYDRLVAIEPKPAMDVLRLAIVAARQRADTASLARLLGVAISRADAPPAIRTEQNVLRQVGALHAAINEARGLIRQNPKYLAAYPSLVGNFGTLGIADSVAAYVARGLRQGTGRASLAPALDPFVNTMLRHAALFGSANTWDAQIAAAMRVDSALSTPSTKFLVASLIVQAVEPKVAELTAGVTGASLLPTAMGASAPPADRRDACLRVDRALASLDIAEARVRDGGDRYAGGGVSQIVAGINAERERLGTLRDVCSRSGG